MIMQEERIYETCRLSHKGYCNAQRPNWQSCFNRDNLFYDPTIYRCNLYLHHLCSNEQFDVMYLSLFAISLNKYFPVSSIFLSEGKTKVLKSPCKIRYRIQTKNFAILEISRKPNFKVNANIRRSHNIKT